MACPDELALTRAISEPEDAEIAAHVAACAVCRESWAGMAKAIELARRIPVAMPSAERREEMRTAILAAGGLRVPLAPARSSQPRRRWAAAITLAAAAAVVIVVVMRPRATEVSVHTHGTVRAHGAAQFVARSSSPDEIVSLHDGVIDVEVAPLHAGERFRVVTADSEIEVRGTAFEVTATLGRLVGVTVTHGLVEVRPISGARTMLGAGESWTAPPVRTASVTPVPAPTVPAAITAPAVRATASGVGPRSIHRAALRSRPQAISERVVPIPPAAAQPARAPQAIAYDEAWAAMRAGDFTRASTTFARAGVLDPDGPLAEDASYWYPVALARAKRSEAMGAFREFLDHYPRSTHAHEASVMLGWLLVDVQQRAEAERRFRAAIDDSSPEVSASARAGLAALARQPDATP
ncbi:hypothetical protein BH11MYX3_BH11MYX3_45610 [soil metagenome]